MTQRRGAAFLEEDVVDLYAFRPPYPDGVYELIAEQASARDRLLDLGCGEGKIARAMTARFGEVVAVDPSANMIRLGQSLERGRAPNLTWVESFAEDLPLEGRFDVVSFASSIHWMEPGRLFDRIGPHLAPQHVLAVVNGDHPHDPPWQAAWDGFLAHWIPRLTGHAVGAEAWAGPQRAYRDHVEVLSEHHLVSDPVRQSIGDFIRCQQSRSTFTLAKLGADQEAFERDLREVVAPHVGDDGLLSYQVGSRVTLARLV